MATADVTVRHVRDGDGEHLVETWDDARRYYAALDAEIFQAPDAESPVDVDRFVTSLREADADADRFARVAELDGRVIGYIVARVDRPVPNAGEQVLADLGKVRGSVEAVGVHRSCWRRGVGRALMHAAEHWARNEGAAVMRTDTNLGRPVSVPFYESLGYDRESVILRKSL